MRVAFLGSPPFATPILARLAQSRRHACVALVARPDRPRGRGLQSAPSPLVELARAKSIAVLQPERARGAEFEAALRAHQPDVLLVASFGEILKSEVLGLARHGALNVHASLLPRHRGASPVQAAILAGDRTTGVSLQRMVLALDAGDVLDEIQTEIGPRENAGALTARLAELGAELALRALDAIEDGTARATPQDPAQVTWAPRIEKQAGAIDWRLAADALDRHVRAMTPWPGARTSLAGGAELAVIEAEPELARAHSAAPGMLLETRGECLVACGSGALRLVQVKPAGKAAMRATDWLRGARLEAGSRLGSTSAQAERG